MFKHLNGFAARLGVPRFTSSVCGILLLVGAIGCQAPKQSLPPSVSSAQQEALVLHEGDVLKITFPGAPNFNTDQAIRRDGMITLMSIGEFKAVGLTPSALEKEVIKLYGPQLQIKEVNVAVPNAVQFIYVTGSVLHPGKISSDRPINILEAIMEAGGFDYTKANLRQVVILRQEDGKTRRFTVNMKRVLDGLDTEPFRLQRSDVIYVPERFSWF